MSDPAPSSSTRATIGALLVRVIVPAWIITGAAFKISAATPKLLPRSVLQAGEAIGFSDHFLLLSLLASIELAAAAVMICIARRARLAAICMLGVFVLVLVIELINGASSCGCLGTFSPPPAAMLALDLALLVGVVCCVAPVATGSAVKGTAIAVVLATVATVGTFVIVGQSRPTQRDLPASWYPRDVSAWIGQSFASIDLHGWVASWPADITTGQQYVIFYGRACEHCEALLYSHFGMGARVPTTLVAVPETANGFLEDGQLDHPCFDCAETRLVFGVDWIITTPLVIALEDGIVRCAVEGEDPESPACLQW